MKALAKVSPFFIFVLQKELVNLLALEVQFIVVELSNRFFVGNVIVLRLQKLLEGHHRRLSGAIYFRSVTFADRD